MCYFHYNPVQDPGPFDPFEDQGPVATSILQGLLEFKGFEYQSALTKPQ